MSDVIHKWNEVLMSLTDEQKKYLLNYEKNNDPLVREFFELDDYVVTQLNSIPNEGCLVIFKQLVARLNKKFEEETVPTED
jgi:hypothetical protein